MSYAKKLLAGPKPDHVRDKMVEAIKIPTLRLEAYDNRDQLTTDTIAAFETLGHVSVDALCCIDIRVAGDKDCFIKCWKLWRELGVRLSPAEKGATDLSQYVELPSGLRFWFHFSSTVCKRVQVGTKMVPQPIYETQCGTETLEIPAIEDNAAPQLEVL